MRWSRNSSIDDWTPAVRSTRERRNGGAARPGGRARSVEGRATVVGFARRPVGRLAGLVRWVDEPRPLPNRRSHPRRRRRAPSPATDPATRPRPARGARRRRRPARGTAELRRRARPARVDRRPRDPGADRGRPGAQGLRRSAAAPQRPEPEPRRRVGRDRRGRDGRPGRASRSSAASPRSPRPSTSGASQGGAGSVPPEQVGQPSEAVLQAIEKLERGEALPSADSTTPEARARGHRRPRRRSRSARRRQPMAATDTKREMLRAVSLFATLSGKELEAVERLADTVDVPAGHVLMRQGASGGEMFVIAQRRRRRRPQRHARSRRSGRALSSARWRSSRKGREPRPSPRPSRARCSSSPIASSTRSWTTSAERARVRAQRGRRSGSASSTSRRAPTDLGRRRAPESGARGYHRRDDRRPTLLPRARGGRCRRDRPWATSTASTAASCTAATGSATSSSTARTRPSRTSSGPASGTPATISRPAPCPDGVMATLRALPSDGQADGRAPDRGLRVGRDAGADLPADARAGSRPHRVLAVRARRVRATPQRARSRSSPTRRSTSSRASCTS